MPGPSLFSLDHNPLDPWSSPEVAILAPVVYVCVHVFVHPARGCFALQSVPPKTPITAGLSVARSHPVPAPPGRSSISPQNAHLIYDDASSPFSGPTPGQGGDCVEVSDMAMKLEQNRNMNQEAAPFTPGGGGPVKVPRSGLLRLLSFQPLAEYAS